MAVPPLALSLGLAARLCLDGAGVGPRGLLARRGARLQLLLLGRRRVVVALLALDNKANQDVNISIIKNLLTDDISRPILTPLQLLLHNLADLVLVS